MGWNISPSEDVENYDNGSFKLPCRTSNVTYSITYVSPEGCSSNTVSYTYVTSGECETPPPPVGTCPASGDVIDPYGARDSGAVWVPIMRVLKNDTYTGYTFTSSDEGKVGSISLGSHTTGNWYLVNAQLSQNTGDYRRTTNVTVHMTGTETPSSGCDYTVGIVQEGSCAKLDDSRYFGPMHYDYKAPGDGDSATRGAIVYVPVLEPFSSNSWTAAFASGTGNFVRNLTVLNSGGGPGQTVSVVVDIDRNDTGAARTFDVICTGTKTDGGICSKTVTITQDPYVPPTCSCSDLTVNGTEETGMSVTIKVSHSGNVKYISEYSLEFTDGSTYGDLIQCESVQDETIILDTPSIPAASSSLTISRAVLVVSDQPNCSGAGVVTASLSTTTITNGSTVTLTI
jgi:hypothetical protein